MLQDFAYDEVILKEPYCVNAFEKEIAYLKALQPDRLLAGFRETANLQAKAMRYKGWEVTEIQGHTLGHYLVAIAQGYASSGDLELRNRVTYISQELAKCQREDGFLFASPEEIFDRVEKQQPAWVPWYTMHKILKGLEVAYMLTKEPTALAVAEKLGDWISNRVNGWSEELNKQVLKVEYGGMNEALYQLYQLTAKQEYLEAAHRFDEMTLFVPLQNKEDILDGLHANTTIPKIIGAMRRYLITQEPFYLEVAQNFWDIVIKHHTYATGGNSEWEHFGKPDVLDGERTACNCETCNTHNMLRLSKMLFSMTKESKYNDYYERTWLNSILSSQNPETGMTMYFQPMETGFFKVFGRPFDDFWCCTGTGMENFTKLSENIFQHEGNTLYINRYVSSQLYWKDNECKVDMKAEFPDMQEITINIQQEATVPIEIRFRIPEWVSNKPIVLQQGVKQEIVVNNGYGIIQVSQQNSEMKICFQTEVKVNTLPDNDAVAAFSYGPFILSAGLGKGMMETTETGVNVTVPLKNFFIKDYLILKEQEPKEWMKHITKNLQKEDGRDVFHLQGTDEDQKLVFTPHFSKYQERYGIYWRLYLKDSQELQVRNQTDTARKEIKRVAIDWIPIGNEQYELAHHIRGEHTQPLVTEGHRYRDIAGSGYVSYQMKVDSTGCFLHVTYERDAIKGQFAVYIDDRLLATENIEQEQENIVIRKYELSDLALQGKNQITVVFRTEHETDRCRICDELYVSK